MSSSEEEDDDGKLRLPLTVEASCTDSGSSGVPDLEERDSGENPQKVAKKGGRSVGKKTTPGIIYLSRIPPFMKPVRVRRTFSQFGTVGRVYLQPEDPLVRKRRHRFGGNKSLKFTEGWVEFADKRVAKAVALALNNTPVGGKKRNRYHDDLWNIRYLAKFRWTHLTEKIAYEQAVRDQRMRTEISQAKRENTHYLQSVEKSKEISAIVERKRRRGASEEELTGRARRSFKQRKVTEMSSEIPTVHSLAEKKDRTNNPNVKLSDSLLKKIFPG